MEVSTEEEMIGPGINYAYLVQLPAMPVLILTCTESILGTVLCASRIFGYGRRY